MQLTGLSFAYPEVRAEERAGIFAQSNANSLEVFYLATCLRVEIAWSGGPNLASRVLEDLYGTDELPEPRVRTDFDAFHHFARVAAGLESAQIGETEVLSQFRQSLGQLLARSGGESSLVRALKAALGVARCSRRSLTMDKAGSLGSAAARMVDSHSQVVIIGGGAMARVVVGELEGSEPVIFSRRAKPVAGVTPRPWPELRAALQSCQAVVSTIPGPIDLFHNLERLSQQPLLVVDLGMPPALADSKSVGNVDYRGVDDVASSVIASPEPSAEEEAALQAKKAWGRLSVSDEASSLINSVVDLVENAVEEEVRRFSSRLSSENEPDVILRQLAERIARRIIHPTVSLLGSTPLAPEELSLVAKALGLHRD